MSTWSDNPVQSTTDDRLDRAKIVGALENVLTGSGLSTPLVLGVYGSWGDGKTSVMRMLQSRIDPEPQGGGAPKSLTLWFDAWKYARSEQALWRALLLAVVEALGDAEKGLPKLIQQSPQLQAKLEEDLQTLRESLYRSQSVTEKGDLQLNWGAAVPFAIDMGLRVATLGMADKLNLPGLLGKLSGKDAEKALKLFEQQEITRYREQVKSLEQFQETLKTLIAREVTERGLVLYVFIDDLDRCLPEDAVGALEAVKLFLDLEGCAFILGMDRDVVQRGILVRYPPVKGPDDKVVSRVDPQQYLDKIIQMPFSLPPLTTWQIQQYLNDLFDRPSVHPHLSSCRNLIEIAAPPNPRTLKRVLNVLSLLLTLDDTSDAERAQHLAKVVLMQVLFEAAYDLVSVDPENLVALEKAAQDQGGKEDIMAIIENHPRLNELLQQQPLFTGMGQMSRAMLVSQTEITSERPRTKAS